MSLDFLSRVHFSIATTIPPESPEDHVLEIRGSIYGDIQLKGVPQIRDGLTKVGVIKALRIDSGSCYEFGYDLRTIADCHSHELLMVSDMLFQTKSMEYKTKLEIETCSLGALLITKLRLRKCCQGTKVGLEAVKSLIRSFADDFVVVAYEDSLPLSIAELKEIGFRKIAGQPYILHDPTIVNPYQRNKSEEE